MLKNSRESYRQTVDLPVQGDVRGIRLPINATIVDISVSGCRLRSWIALDRGVRVLKVIGFSDRRGDASSTRVLYEDLQPRQE